MAVGRRLVEGLAEKAVVGEVDGADVVGLKVGDLEEGEELLVGAAVGALVGLEL